MTMRVRAVLMLTVALAMMGLASCDHYVCSSGATFGNSSCTATGSGLGSGTGGNSATSAFAFAVDEGGTIDGYTLSTGGTAGGTFQATSSYTAPIIPTNELGYGMVVAQKQFLYTAFIGTGQIYGWTIGSGGGLTAISGSPFSAPYLIGIGSSQGLQDMIVNPKGTLLFVDDVSVEGIYVYTIGAGGVLTARERISVLRSIFSQEHGHRWAGEIFVCRDRRERLPDRGLFYRQHWCAHPSPWQSVFLSYVAGPRRSNRQLPDWHKGQ